MAFTGEQLSVVRPATRLFVMRATRSGVPFDALHVYDQSAARMRVKLLSMLSMVDASGVEFSRTGSERIARWRACGSPRAERLAITRSPASTGTSSSPTSR
jgi:hypothetical protein